jgi:hypothetical protein
MIKEQIITAFKHEFHFVQDKFEIIDLLGNESPMDYHIIDGLKLPNDNYNIVWHPGVYLFLGNGFVYRVGVSMINGRARVMEHLDACTSTDNCGIWDINNFDDKSILLFTIKNKNDRHWLLALEAYLEEKFTPLIRSRRIG